MLRKAPGLAADEIVLDLEDAVPGPQKPEARGLVVAALSGGAFGDRRVAVRINGRGTPWHDEDIAALRAAAPPGATLIVPKVETAADIPAVAAALARDDVGLQALIETALGLASAGAIATSSPRLESLILGYADLASSLGRIDTSAGSWRFVQEALLLAARAHGLQAIDGPSFVLGEGGSEALARDCAVTAGMGYDGKWAIHPMQIGPIEAAFTPSAEAIAQAQAILARLDDVGGASALGGAMVDEAMRPGAMRILARAGIDP